MDLIRRDDDGRVSIVDLKSNHRSQAEEVTRDPVEHLRPRLPGVDGQDADSIETYELEERERRSEPVNWLLLHDMEARMRAAVDALRHNRCSPCPSRRSAGVVM